MVEDGTLLQASDFVVTDEPAPEPVWDGRIPDGHYQFGDYVFVYHGFGELLEFPDGQTIVAFTRQAAVRDARCVLHSNGYVKRVDESEFIEMIAEENARRAASGRGTLIELGKISPE